MANDGVVYLIQEPRGVGAKDFSSAQRYGRIEPILSTSDHPSHVPGPCMFKLAKAFRNFNPDTDYVCFAGGDPLGVGLAVIALRDCGVREFSYLRWERERDPSGVRKDRGFYVPVKIEIR